MLLLSPSYSPETIYRLDVLVVLFHKVISGAIVGQKADIAVASFLPFIPNIYHLGLGLWTHECINHGSNRTLLKPGE